MNGVRCIASNINNGGVDEMKINTTIIQINAGENKSRNSVADT